MRFSPTNPLFRLITWLLLANVSGAVAAEPKKPGESEVVVDKVVQYTLPAQGPDGTTVQVTQAILADGNLGSAEEIAAALNGGTAVSLSEVIIVNGGDAEAQAGVSPLNAAAAESLGTALPAKELNVPGGLKPRRSLIPYFFSQLRVWKKGAVETGKNLLSLPFQTVSLIRSVVAGGITHYGLIITHQVPPELALKASLLSAGVAYGASSAIAFLKLWYNSLRPWEGLAEPKSKLHVAGAALYKGIVFITFYSYASLLAVEVAKPGDLPHTLPQWGVLIGTSTVYVLSQLFWGVKFLNDQKKHNLSDTNLLIKMGVLGVIATAIVKYMAVGGPHSWAGYAALMGTGVAALFAQPIKSFIKRRLLGMPDVSTCKDVVTD